MRKHWAAFFAISLVLAIGCAELTQPSKEKMGASIQEDLAKQTGKVVKDVSLVRETDHKLTGFATLENGDTVNVTVTVDRDQFMWVYPGGFGERNPAVTRLSAEELKTQESAKAYVRALLADEIATYEIAATRKDEGADSIIHRELPAAVVAKEVNDLKSGFGSLTVEGKTLSFFYSDGVGENKLPSVSITAHPPGQD